MNVVTTPDSVLALALSAMERTPDARLRSVMGALTRHLHAFVQEVALTENEFEQALGFLVDIGQASGETKNEVVLAADLLGLSTAGCADEPPARRTGRIDGRAARAVLARQRPAVRARRIDRARRHARHAADSRRHGARCTRRADRGRDGRRLAGLAGRPLREPGPDAGGHEPARAFSDRRQGRFRFSSVRPAGYPVPTDGPCGDSAARAATPSEPAGAPALHGQQAGPQGAGHAGVCRRR